jgi:hypothetical protein
MGKGQPNQIYCCNSSTVSELTNHLTISGNSRNLRAKRGKFTKNQTGNQDLHVEVCVRDSMMSGKR